MKKITESQLRLIRTLLDKIGMTEEEYVDEYIDGASLEDLSSLEASEVIDELKVLLH